MILSVRGMNDASRQVHLSGRRPFVIYCPL